MFTPGIKIKEEKGFLLLSALLVIIFLTILSAVIFNQSISENSLVKIDLDELKAKHNAEFGLACVSYELINSGTSWVTHIAAAASPYALSKNRTALPIALPSIAEREGNDPDDDGLGNYQSLTGEFVARVFKDPMQPSYVDDIIVLSRGKSGTQTYLLAAKISAQSLYQYFIFTPYTTEKNAVDLYANGGKIHINGDFGFWNNVHIKDVSELSLSGYIYSKNYSEVPPPNECNLGPGQCFWDTYFYMRRDPWQTKNSLNTGTPLDYYHNLDGWVQGDAVGLYMYNQTYCTGAPRPGCTNPYTDGVPSTYLYIPCTDPNLCTSADPDSQFTSYNRNLYTYKDYLKRGVSSGGTYTNVSIKPCNPVFQKCNPDITSGLDAYNNNLSPIDIPNRLNEPGSGAPYEYDWDRYWESSCTPERQPSCGVYWDMNGDGTKEHIWSTPSTRKTNFTNTLYQEQGWQQFLQYNSTINNVVKEHNTGGAAISPIRINEQIYFNQAETNGMYIYKDNDGEPLIKINGLPVAKEGNQFKVGTTVIAEKISFVDVNSTNQKDVIKLDIRAMKDNNVGLPSNGIIYADYNIALSNAKQLPTGGLTTVTSENCYLAGDYNYEDAPPAGKTTEELWQPSAVIASKSVYTLSQNFFNNPPQTVQDTIHNPNYPYPYNTTDPDKPYQPYDEATWNANHSTTMAPVVDKDYRYYVSLVGYMAHPPNELERWSDDKKRIVVGAFVNLEYDNFKAQGVVDYDKQRCYNEDGSCGYPGGCRNCTLFPGWDYDMTSLVPGAGNNIYKFESRYDITDASTLPPGALTGYSPNVLLNLVDDDYNFSHHYIQLN